MIRDAQYIMIELNQNISAERRQDAGEKAGEKAGKKDREGQ